MTSCNQVDPRRFIASLSTQVGMGCARWTYEPEEAVLKSAPRMDWVERLLFFLLFYSRPHRRILLDHLPFPIDCKPFLPGP